MKKTILVAIIMLVSSMQFFAQLKFGTDVYSRYVWRGLKLGSDSPSLQPGLSYSTYGFTAGFWGAYSYSGDSSAYAENDIYISYTYTVEKVGTFTLLATDYYIPSLGIPLGYYQKSGGAHVVEAGVSYNGPETFPVAVSGYLNFYGDADNSIYIQLGYPFVIDYALLTPAIGFVPTKSVYYATKDAAIINLSLTASKSISITDKFSIPINVSYIANPSQDISYLVFGASFTF
jgi:hypothetical protein